MVTLPMHIDDRYETLEKILMGLFATTNYPVVDIPCFVRMIGKNGRISPYILHYKIICTNTDYHEGYEMEVVSPSKFSQSSDFFYSSPNSEESPINSISKEVGGPQKIEALESNPLEPIRNFNDKSKAPEQYEVIV